MSCPFAHRSLNRGLMNKFLSFKIGMDCTSSMNWFAPATARDTPEGATVLPLKFLTHPNTGSPGVFLFPGDIENINKPPYNLFSVKDKLIQGNKTVRFSFCPILENTVIPMDLQSVKGSGISGIGVEKTKYVLQDGQNQEKLPGYSTNVKLDFMVWHAKKWARRFQIDGVVLLDPGFKHLLVNPEAPVCLLGMDFMAKHPHLLFEPEYDSHRELEFKLAKGSFVDRSYDFSTNAWEEVIIHVDGYHNIDTGNIGCGVFFKSGSIFNSFGGVSKRDAFGNKLEGLWKERGILVAIVKALQIVETLSIGSDFMPEAVIIKTSSNEIEGMLAPTKWFATRIRPPHSDQRIQDLESIFPPTIRDVAMYYYHRFVRRQPRFKIKIECVAASEKPGEILAAKLLAVAGAEMDEFRMGVGSDHGMMKLRSPDIIHLESYFALRSNSIYVSFGAEGHFLIPQKKASTAMIEADKAGLRISVECGVGKPGNISEQENTILSRLGSLRMYGLRLGGNYSPLDTSAPRDSLKEKSKLGAHLNPQKYKAYNNSAFQGLSEFDNDWNVEINDATSSSDSSIRTGHQCLGIAEQARHDFINHNEYPEKGIINCQDEEALRRREEHKTDAREMWQDGLNSRANMDASQSDIRKVLEMWKINPTEARGVGQPEVRCGVDCGCRIVGECSCQLDCRCEIADGFESKLKSKSKKVRTRKETEGMAGETCNPEPSNKLGDRSQSRRLIGTSRPRMLAGVKTPMQTEFERRSAICGGLKPSYLAMFPNEKFEYQPDPESRLSTFYESRGPISKSKEKVDIKEKELKVVTSGELMDRFRHQDSRTVNQLIGHKARLIEYEKALKYRGISYPYGLQFGEPIRTKSPEHPMATRFAETLDFSDEQKLPEEYGFTWEQKPRGRHLDAYSSPRDPEFSDLSNPTLTMNRTMTPKISERLKSSNEIHHKGCSFQFSAKDELRLEECY